MKKNLKNLHFKYEARPSLVVKKMGVDVKLNPNDTEKQNVYVSKDMDIVYDPEEGLLIAVNPEKLEKSLERLVSTMKNFKLPLVVDEHYLVRTRQWGFFSMKDQITLENKGFVKEGEEWVFTNVN